MCYIHRNLVFKKNPYILLLKGPLDLDFGTAHLMAHILDHMNLDFVSHTMMAYIHERPYFKNSRLNIVTD